MEYVVSLESSLTVQQMLEKSFGLWLLFTSLKLQLMLKKQKSLQISDVWAYNFLPDISFVEFLVLIESSFNGSHHDIYYLYTVFGYHVEKRLCTYPNRDQNLEKLKMFKVSRINNFFVWPIYCTY